jgi:hypothetical protein
MNRFRGKFFNILFIVFLFYDNKLLGMDCDNSTTFIDSLKSCDVEVYLNFNVLTSGDRLSNNKCDSSELIQYVFWKHEGKYFVKKFDACGSFRIVNDSAFRFVEKIKEIRKLKIRNKKISANHIALFLFESSVKGHWKGLYYNSDNVRKNKELRFWHNEIYSTLSELERNQRFIRICVK